MGSEVIVVAVDPDTIKPGVAVFKEGRLVHAGALHVNDAVAHVVGWLHPLGKPTALVIEMPQQYGRKGDQRDFLRLATIVGRFQQIGIMAGAQTDLIAPKKWKGETPKSVCTLRTWLRLSEYERAFAHIPATVRKRLEAGRGVTSGEGSDVLDAIGIGLWKLGRLHARSR